MNQKPTISILTLTYNHKKYIAECLDSVYNQTFQSWEQIIIDDGSTDGTWEIIQDYVKRDSRFRAFRQQHVGPFRMVETYNRALFLSTGKLIAILEGDDRWPINKLEIQHQLHTPGVIFSYGSTTIIDDDGAIVRPYMSFEQERQPIPALDIRTELLLRKAGIMPVSVMIEKNSLLAIGGFRAENVVVSGRIVTFPSVDYPTFLRYLLSDGHVQRSNVILGYWRQHSTQTTRTYENIFHEGAFQLAVLGITASQQRKQYKRVYRAHRKFASGFYLTSLRKALQDRNKEKAMSAMGRLLWWGGTKRRLQALYGMVALLLGVNMEWPFWLFDRILGGQRRRI